MSVSLNPWRLAFYTAGLPFDGRTIYETGLGGSESALFYIAREFAARGHQVQVFCHTFRPGLYEGVEYRHLQEFPQVAATEVFDVFIVSRFPQVFAYPFRSRLNVMWNHDNLVSPQDYRQATCRADLFFTLSSYHEAEYLTQLPELAPYCHRTTNGVDLELTGPIRLAAVKNMNKVIYASRPERGLDILLEYIWPRLLSVQPHLNLFIAGYHAPEMPGNHHIPRLLAGARQVTLLGSLPKPEFYRHLAEAALLLYPCSFPEISCIIALEAQALGTPIITTHDFALPETVGVSDYLIPGRPALPAYQEIFCTRALSYLDDPQRYARDTAAGLAWVESRYSWATIADHWLDLFSRHWRAQPTSRARYSLVRVSSGDPEPEAVLPLALTPPPAEIKHWPAVGQDADIGAIQQALAPEVKEDWLLILDDRQPPVALPQLEPYLESERLTHVGFRPPLAPPGHWAAVLCRRNRLLKPDSGLEVRIP